LPKHQEQDNAAIENQRDRGEKAAELVKKRRRMEPCSC